MTVFDAGTYIPENIMVDVDTEDEMLDKLDEMLYQYSIKHAFKLLTHGEIEEFEQEGKDIPLMQVMYLVEDEMTFELVFLLWAKTVANVSDERIEKALKSRHSNN